MIKGSNLMDNYWGGFVTGAITCFVTLLILAKTAFGTADDLCERQGWIGEACQCRLMEKKQVVHD